MSRAVNRGSTWGRELTHAGRGQVCVRVVADEPARSLAVVNETTPGRDRAQTGDFDAHTRANPPPGTEPDGQDEEETNQLNTAGLLVVASLQCAADLQPWPDVFGRNRWVRLASMHGLVGP
jgi:hypothetical protein